MRTVHSVAELREQIAVWRKQGDGVALVPTMGNLHAGHLRLIQHARQQASRTVASVFVNPLQFGPNEDFERYPRTLAQDAKHLAAAGCDLLFAPSADEMYPRGQSDLTLLKAPSQGSVLCGQYRPGHFDGVVTVVNILFNQVQPDVAVFGQKDFQQLFLIQRMAEDLHQAVRVVGVLTEREPDGLAMSSRNQYLSAEQRARAPALHRALNAVAASLRAGRRDYMQLCAEQVKVLESEGFRPQYLEVRTPQLQVPGPTDSAFVIFGAAYLGTTRLIDNLQMDGAVV